MGDDVGKEDSGISVPAEPFQSPGGAVRDLQLSVTEPRGAGGAGDLWALCAPGMTLCLFSVFIPGDS